MIAFSVSSIKGNELVQGREYRVALRRRPISAGEFVLNADEDDQVFLLTSRIPFPEAFASRDATALPSVDADTVDALAIGVAIEEARRTNGPMARIGEAKLDITKDMLLPAARSGSPMRITVPVGQCTVDIIMSVLRCKEPTPLRTEGTRLTRTEATALRAQLAERVRTRDRLRDEHTLSLRFSAPGLRQFAAHLRAVSQSMRHEADTILSRSNYNATAGLLRLQNRLAFTRDRLTRLEMESQYRDVATEAVSLLAEHDALERAISVSKSPSTLANRLKAIRTELDQREAAHDVSAETVGLLDELDSLEELAREQSTVALPEGAEWDAVIASDRQFDDLRTRAKALQIDASWHTVFHGKIFGLA